MLGASDGATADMFGSAGCLFGRTGSRRCAQEGFRSGRGIRVRDDARVGGAVPGSVAHCDTTFCVDGVCCDTACGGDSATDCLVCSAAAGATADGTCTPLTGMSCSDDDVCTQTDMCQAGVCVGSDPLTCFALDQCHYVGKCHPSVGCPDPPKVDGVGCDDGDACTQTETCQAGICTGGTPVVCAAPDECHAPGTCDPASGTCSNPAKTDGAPCTAGTCESGKCVPTPDAGPDGEAGAGGQAGAGGAAGSSGATGTGGSAGKGGSAGSPGSGGSAGAVSSGGSAGAQTGGAAGDAPSETSDDTGGCGCRTGGRRSSSFAWIGVGIAIAMAARRRRDG